MRQIYINVAEISADRSHARISNNNSMLLYERKPVCKLISNITIN
jgi:hypothetical protein